MLKNWVDDGGFTAQFFNVATHGLFKKFKKVRTHDEQFNIALTDLLKSPRITAVFKCKTKLLEHAISSRQDGNKSYVSNQFYEALRKYTESIIYAIDSSEELALSYANRSAASFKLNKYEDCVKDIDRALNLEYPDRLKSKLYKRKGMCLMALERVGAQASFQQALRWLDKMDLTKKERTENEVELKAAISMPDEVSVPPTRTVRSSPPKIPRPNPKIPTASDAVTVKYSEEYGLHLVATRNIKPGELLILEKPFCNRLYSQYIYTNCSYCIGASWSMIPCNCCVNVAYCSEECRDKAWNEYHEVECPILGMLLCLEITDAVFLCLRMAIIATEKGKKLTALKQELIDVDRQTDMCAKLYSEDGKIHSDKYRSLYCNEEHNKHTEMFPLKLITAADSIAAVVCLLARETEMFGKKLKLDSTLAKNPNVTFIGGLMFKQRHLGSQLKTHMYGSDSGTNLVVFGDSLMALGSLMNHSCDANTARQWRPDLMDIHYARHPIQAGEQLFDNYGPEFHKMELTHRQISCSLWNFQCHCAPCTENWPQMDELLSYKQQDLPQENKKKLDKAINKFRKCSFLLHKGEMDNTVNELLKLIEMLFTFAKRPCKELVTACELLTISHVVDEAIWDYEIDDTETDLKMELYFFKTKQQLFDYHN